jgi:hypothetical protein
MPPEAFMQWMDWARQQQQQGLAVVGFKCQQGLSGVSAA